VVTFHGPFLWLNATLPQNSSFQICRKWRRYGNNDDMNSIEYPCPSCGFYTISRDYFGTFDICPICDWEDDNVQLANPACGGGANQKSLIESQQDILKVVPLHIKNYEGYVRAERWRPLNENEIRLFKSEKAEKCWKNKAFLNLENVYWIKGLP
jgi:hypothetical protein